jgi:hypothetical protein
MIFTCAGSLRAASEAQSGIHEDLLAKNHYNSGNEVGTSIWVGKNLWRAYCGARNFFRYLIAFILYFFLTIFVEATSMNCAEVEQPDVYIL